MASVLLATSTGLWKVKESSSMRAPFSRASLVGILVLGGASDATSQGNQTLSGTHGVVSAMHPLGAQAGLAVLKSGGNAIDAAVATSAALTVVQPYASGIGGVGGYMLIYVAKEKRVYALDFIGVAPKAARVDQLNRYDLWNGYKSALVPGTVGGWAAAAERFGTKPLRELLEPAIEYAENGFPISRGLSENLKNPVRNKSFLPPGTKPPEPGDMVTRKELANTYRTIANEGPSAFYGGSIARKIVDEFQKNGGLLTLEDFAGYKAVWRDPISIDYRGHAVYAHPPGSSGMSVLQSLNIMENWSVHGLGHNSVDFIHVIAEVQKMAFADDDRVNTGKDYAKIPLDQLLSKSYGMAQGLRLNLDKAQFHPPAGSLSRQTGTTHFAIADAEGNVVTATQTSMYELIGPVADTGIMWGNGMCYYSLEPGDVNRVEGGQRARYVMTPAIVFREGKPWFALGGAGGWGIPQAVLQVIVRVVDFEMDLQEAISAQRITLCYKDNFIPYVPGTTLALEGEFPENVVLALERRGHLMHGTNYPGMTGGFAGVAGVMLSSDGKVLQGAVEPPGGYVAIW
jgi:gamma-glutamyltranspeptidase/glutathione hydrolase